MVLTGKKANELIKLASRSMRKSPTASETRFWELVRKNRLGGFRFRRQHPIENFIVDYYCPELKLVIEIQGSVHDKPDAVAKDHERVDFLKAIGYRYLEFDAQRILSDPRLIETQLLDYLRKVALPPKGGAAERSEAEGGQDGRFQLIP
jgi:very-short-patch-repair endonuclease